MWDTAIYLLTQILNWGYSDVDFLLKLCENNGLELDIEDITMTYWKADINILIYDAIQQVAYKFFSEYQQQIEQLLNIGNLDLYMSENEIYEIYVNYLDSHLWIKHEKVQALFESSRFTI